MTNTRDPVIDLVAAHAAGELHDFRGSLTSALHVVDQGWLPDAGDPAVATHLATLRGYLAANGGSVDDEFLLLLGLIAPGGQRGIVPPLLVLEEKRGGFSVRRQREAAGAIEQLRKALAIGRRFFPSLPQASREAIQALSAAAQKGDPDRGDERLLRYRRLSHEDAERAADVALSFINESSEQIAEIGTDILHCLATFRFEPLGERVCRALLASEVFYPPCLFRGGGAFVADELLRRIESANDRGNLNLLLSCLAWTRARIAEERFQVWAKSPPEWAADLHVPTGRFLNDAAVCLDSQARIRELIQPVCRRLAREGSPANAVRCRVPADVRCPSCSGQTSALFDFGKIPTSLLAGVFAEAPRRLTACLDCAAYEPSYARYRSDGDVEIFPIVRPDHARTNATFTPQTRYLEHEALPPFACAQPFGLEDASTLGGVPMWLQDAEYPACLDCGELMLFLAQHDNSPLGEEGIFYAFFCPSCRMSAVTFQQT